MSDNANDKSKTKSALQIARSGLLDCFADVEVATIGLQARLGMKSNGSSLGQRLVALRKFLMKAELNSQDAVELNNHIERLEQLNAIRGDIVHARMHVAQMAGQTRAWFINSRECEAQYPSARVLSADQFVSLKSELNALAKALTKLAT